MNLFHVISEQTSEIFRFWFDFHEGFHISEATKNFFLRQMGPAVSKRQKLPHQHVCWAKQPESGRSSNWFIRPSWKLVKFQNTKKFFNKESSWESPRDQTLRCFRTYPSTPPFHPRWELSEPPPTWQAGCRHEPTKEPSSVRLLTCTSQAWRFRSFEKMRAIIPPSKKTDNELAGWSLGFVGGRF